MALELEQIQPWDGQSGTGAEVRGALNRNFEKLKDLSILAGMPIKDLFTSVDLLPRPGISGNNYLVGENLYVWSESVLDYVDIGSVKGQDGLDGIDGKDSKQVTTVAYDGTRPVLRLLTDGSGVSYTVPTFSKSDGSTTTIITEAATYTNAEALSSKVDKGGSDKTLKQVEDEIVQLAGDISQVYVPSKYESIIADENGWVQGYIFEPYSLTIDFNSYGNDIFIIDSLGFVSEKTGFKEQQPVLINKDIFVKDQFSDAVIIKTESAHLAFPAICVDNNGILHAFWRKGSGHVSDDGSIMYKRSIDNGNTWIDETTALQGHELVSDYYSDWRDSRTIFTRDGKVLHLTFKSWTNDGGVTYDANRTQLIATIFPLLNGKIDIVNKTEIIISNQIPGKGQASAGALFYHKNELYAVTYGGVLAPNDNNLIKSSDNGLTWQFVGRIGTYNNECAVGVIGDRMVAISRNVAATLSDYYISDDNGVTWVKEKELGALWHGMDAKGFGDYVIVAGRHRIDGANYGYSFVLYDKFGNEVFPKFDIHNFAGNGDCAYGQICSFQRWVYFIYYNAGATSTIYFKKILRSEILGLNY